MVLRLLILQLLPLTLMIFFTNIGSSLADRIPPPDPNFTSPLKSFNISSTMFLATSSDEVDKLVKKKKNKVF